MKRLHYLFLILTIAWMIVIFMFSSQSGKTSSNTSGGIVQWIISVCVPNFDSYDTVKQSDIFDLASLIIRKGAHFTEYAILGFFSFITTITGAFSRCNDTSEYSKQYMSKKYLLVCSCVIFSCIYAISDELHQGFVDGRSPAVLDVCIDTLGAAAGILISLIITKKIVKKTY